MTDWKAELGFEIIKHEPEVGMPTYLVREDFAEDREATITERVLWDALVGKTAANASRAAMVRLSRALGNPCEVEANPGESVEDALIRLAAERIEQQPAASGELADAQRLARLVLELAEAVDNAADDIGGSRPQLDILRDAVKAAHGITAPGAPATQKSEPAKTSEPLSHTDLLQLRGN